MKGPSLYTSPLPQTGKVTTKTTKRGEDSNKKGTGLAKELTPEEKLAKRIASQKKVDNPKRTSGIDNRTTEQIREDKKPKRGENPNPHKGTGLVE